WQVQDLPLVPHLGPRTVLQVLRILQEAVTNVLKHADARTITVRTGADELSPGRHRVCIQLIDDGAGLGGATLPRRGFPHMRRRGADIGATLEIDGTGRGTRVCLLIPVEETMAVA